MPCFCNSLLSPASICLFVLVLVLVLDPIFRERGQGRGRGRLNHFHVSTPFIHAQTSPSTSSKRNIIIATNAPTDRVVNATANGSRKIVSTSKIRNTIA